MKTRTGLQLRGGGTLPEENGGTGSTDLEDITVGKALGDGDGNNIKSTYSTKSEALRTATYTLQGQVKMGSTTNGGNITSGDSDEVVPTIKNICDWVRNNFKSLLPYTAANGWTRIERYGKFPPQRKDLEGNPNPALLYLIAAIPSSHTGENDQNEPLPGPALVYGGFTYLNSWGIFQNALILPYNIAVGGSADGYLLVSTSPLGVDDIMGIGASGRRLGTSGDMKTLTDGELDGISYVYKEIVV